MIARGWEEVGFAADTYRLSDRSPFRRGGDDGKDLGVDWDALQQAQAGSGGSAECGETAVAPGPPKPRIPQR